MIEGGLIRRSRKVYHRLPLPPSIKYFLRWVYRQLPGKLYRDIRNIVSQGTWFGSPSIKSATQRMAAPDYIIWGVIDWHFRHQRPQQLALGLAASGRRVFYVSSSFIDDKRAGFDLESLDIEGHLFQIRLYAKGAPEIYSLAPRIETILQLRMSIGKMLEWSDSRHVICLVQHPFWWDVASVLPDSRVIYDCMDHHEGFENTAPELLSLEHALFRGADMTVTTSEGLNRIVGEHTECRVLIRNAGDFKHFSRPPATVYRDRQKRRVIGYYGAIAEWFDQDLVEAIAARFPECCILLIGADTVNAQARLGRLPNVKFVGEVSYAILPHYLYGFDVCLLPFKIIPLTLATNPVKVYEYLGAGKPVISVDLPEMKQFGERVRVATTTDEFLSAIADVLHNPESAAAVRDRREFAREQTWLHRVDMLIKNAESIAGEPQVSVVVVTYDNLAFTRACLASLDEHSHYSRLEIIVVDNASADGTGGFLAEWVEAAAHRKVLFNTVNRGFAAASNQGLAAANGAYLVLLNNDTYVTPGWVGTLVKHFRRDKRLGLIGPVTNNIGNEARISIAYTSMGEMLQASARYTRRHIGQTFPLSTAAFFCVMMSREVYVRTGPLDESFGRGFFEDDDYCRRIEQLKLRIVCARDVFIHHHLSASFDKLGDKERQALFDKNKSIYEAKWGKWVPHTYRQNRFSEPGISGKNKFRAGFRNICRDPAQPSYAYVI
jgi:GT2 family glycosyltransferase/glycosyltransferase involved in cell wall biosynthesis